MLKEARMTLIWSTFLASLRTLCIFTIPILVQKVRKSVERFPLVGLVLLGGSCATWVGLWKGITKGRGEFS